MEVDPRTRSARATNLRLRPRMARSDAPESPFRIAHGEEAPAAGLFFLFHDPVRFSNLRTRRDKTAFKTGNAAQPLYGGMGVAAAQGGNNGGPGRFLLHGSGPLR